MIALLRRLATVWLVGMALLLLLENALTRDTVIPEYFRLKATGTDAAGDSVAWTFRVNELGNATLGDHPATVDKIVNLVLSWDGRLELTGTGSHADAAWQATVANNGVTLNGDAATLSDLGVILRRTAAPPGVEPTRAATVADVLREAEAGNIPMPVRSRVCFPEFSYHQAFPEATDEPEYVIERFAEAPMLADLDSMPQRLREHFPESLPPVAERLPRNPAVVRGPDGIGQYGGVWRQATDVPGGVLTKACSESFTRFDTAGRIQPALAYKWEISDNNRVYTFYLRKGHRWSDGEPFTVQDILWVTNTVIGSAPGGDRDWMMETDGHTLLYAEDIRDWSQLAAVIVQQADADAPSMGTQLAKVSAEVAGAEVLPLLRQVVDAGKADAALRGLIVDRLNIAFRSPKLFDAEVFGAADLHSELQQLTEQGFSRLSAQQRDRVLVLRGRNDLYRRASADIDELAAVEVNRLNLLMFRLHYADWVEPARVTRVVIEAVPDEDGDDSHIIRFTFPRPNSIFLERTPTFMFYRGLFSVPRHATAPYYVDGTDRLAVSDILDWRGLFETLRQAADDSPGKRIWNRLDDDLRSRIIQSPPNTQSDSAYKQEIVDALNEVFAPADVYDRTAWGRVDFEAAPTDLTGEGISYLRRDRAGFNLLREMLIRNDRLRRVHAHGIEDLTDEERFQFNQSVFRAAFDRYARPNRPFVAVNREDGLNVAAANHPNRYTSWVHLTRRLGVYHPTENPHPPTLQAWRVVTEPIAHTLVAVRNPYYYRVDPEGNQLPYIDVMEVKREPEKPNVLLALASGNIDFQVRDLTFDDFTFLKAHEHQGDYEVFLWANDYCGEVNFFPLQAHSDPALAELQTHPEFRHAMSLALNRQEIIDVVFGGLGEPGQYAAPEGSPYYNETLANAFIQYDPDEANRLLDELGLDKRNPDGTRLLPDGRPLILNLDARTWHPLPVLQLACVYWNQVGINVRLQLRTGQLINQMLSIGILDIGVAKEGINYRAPLQPGGFAPSHPAECPQWSQWVAYLTSGGRAGWEPPERLREIDRLWQRVITAKNDEEKFAAWHVLAERTAHDLPLIGIMTSPGQVVYVRRGFKNVPRVAMAGWITHEPGNTCPEAYYFEQPR